MSTTPRAGVFASSAFRRLFAGMSTSMLGDSVLLLVLSIWVKTLTGSNAQAGLTFFWMVVPALFAPLLGMYLDRIRRKPLLVWGNLASALVVLPLLLVRDAGDVWIVYAVAFGYGISFVVLPAALNGLLKEILPEDELVAANSSLQTVKEGYRLIGPLVGAALFAAFGGGVVAVVDAVSFLIAALVIGSIRVREDAPEREEERWLREMTAGIRHLAREPVLKHLVVAFALTIFVLGYIESSMYALLDFYHRPATFAGVLVTIQGVGAVAGGLTASRWIRRLGEPGGMAVALTLLALSVAIIALTSSLLLVFVGLVLCGYSLPLLMVAFNTALQRRTPQRLMGRVSAATETLLGAPQAISLVVGSVLVTLISFHLIFAIIALVTGIGACYLVATMRSALWRVGASPEEGNPEAVGVPLPPS